jgi:hypothetical protein
VTCGFPSKGGELGAKTRVRGQCWSPEASADLHAESFISPVEDGAATVAAILAHEMIHAALPLAGHGKAFQVAARRIGHKRPFTTSHPTPAFMAWAAPLIHRLPGYPHRRLNALRPVAQPKKQGARMLKAECIAETTDGICGYTVRITRRWVETIGAPHCPRHGAMTLDGQAATDGDQG